MLRTFRHREKEAVRGVNTAGDKRPCRQERLRAQRGKGTREGGEGIQRTAEQRCWLNRRWGVRGKRGGSR